MHRDISLTSDRPTFKFYHLWGAHAPFNLNEHLQITDPIWSRDGYRQTGQAELEITRQLLDALRQHGIYDSSTIVILADHGNPWPWPPIGVRPAQGMTLQPGLFNVRQHVRGSGLPLMLIKPPHAAGPMAVSDAPVCSGDLPKTIADLIGLDGEFPGQSMFRISPTASRKRLFRHYMLTQETSVESNFLPPMSEYEIDGFAWSPASWRPTWRTFDGAIATQPPAPYALGTPIQFTHDGNAGSFTGDGWGTPEGGYTWSNASQAELFLPLPAPPSGDLILSANVAMFLDAPNLPAQQVQVAANNHPVGEWRITRKGLCILTIPKALASGPMLKLTFTFPNSAIPRQIGLGADDRQLAVAFSNMLLSDADSSAWLGQYHLGQPFIFGAGGNADNFQADGWAQGEDGFTWMQGDQADLYLPVASAQNAFLLKAFVQQHLPPREGAPQSVQIFLGDRHLADWQVTGPGTYQAQIPADPNRLHFLHLTFKMPAAISMHELNGDPDQRKLSVAFQSLILEPQQ